MATDEHDDDEHRPRHVRSQWHQHHIHHNRHSSSASSNAQPSRFKSFRQLHRNRPWKQVFVLIGIVGGMHLYGYGLLFGTWNTSLNTLSSLLPPTLEKEGENPKLFHENDSPSSFTAGSTPEQKDGITIDDNNGNVNKFPLQGDPRSLMNVQYINSIISKRKHQEYVARIAKRREERRKKLEQMERQRLEDQLRKKEEEEERERKDAHNDEQQKLQLREEDLDDAEESKDETDEQQPQDEHEGEDDNQDKDEMIADAEQEQNSDAAEQEGEGGGHRKQLPPNAQEIIELGKRINVRRTPARNKVGKRGGGGGGGGTTANSGMRGAIPVLIVMSICVLFRVCVNVLIAHTADGDETTATTRSSGGGGLPLFFARNYLTTTTAGTMGGGINSTLRQRRRMLTLSARRAQYEALVNRLNTERIANGERPISAESLRLVLTSRDFTGNDYERLLTFNEENGPAMGALVSSIGATEAEIQRCPQRIIEREDDDLLKVRRHGGHGVVSLNGANDRQAGMTMPTTTTAALLTRSSSTREEEGGGLRPQCAVCLEPYQVGDSVRTIPCFHTFHCQCIDPWLAQKAECPICKHPALA